MVDFDKFNRVRRAFSDLLCGFSTTWPTQDIEYVEDEINHREFDDALENLIALGLRNGRGFTSDQIRQIEDLAAAINMRDSAWLCRLRDSVAAKRNP
jgi:hypothetical protein